MASHAILSNFFEEKCIQIQNSDLCCFTGAVKQVEGNMSRGI